MKINPVTNNRIINNKPNFKTGQRVLVTDGNYKGSFWFVSKVVLVTTNLSGEVVDEWKTFVQREGKNTCILNEWLVPA